MHVFLQHITRSEQNANTCIDPHFKPRLRRSKSEMITAGPHLEILPVVEASHCFPRQMESVVVIQGVVVRHAGLPAKQLAS